MEDCFCRARMSSTARFMVLRTRPTSRDNRVFFLGRVGIGGSACKVLNRKRAKFGRILREKADIVKCCQNFTFRNSHFELDSSLYALQRHRAACRRENYSRPTAEGSR